MSLTSPKFRKAMRAQAHALGLRAWRDRAFANCPFEAGSELAEIWEDARTEARRMHERGEIVEAVAPTAMDQVVARLNMHFRGES